MSQTTGKYTLVTLGVISLFGIITFALAAATLGTLNKRLNVIENKLPSPITSISSNTNLATSINFNEILGHLLRLQHFADNSNGTRAINTIGFNDTVDYIYDYLMANTDFIVKKTYFSVRDFALNKNPILLSCIDGASCTNYSYSANTSTAQFIHVRYSTSSNLSTQYSLSIIPNGGCTETDWQNAYPTSVAGRVALVKRGGDCAFASRAAHAPKFNATGILFYNGLDTGGNAPFEVSLGQTNTLPALFVTNEIGENLAKAVNTSSETIKIHMEIDVKNLPPFSVGNVCADTRIGDVTQTIIIGSHSDSVLAGPGINDNGSGSAANLGLALAIYRLFQISSYEKYKYRIRFCWWGAEEVGLLGAEDHVKNAKLSSTSGERIQDYLINLNFDMLGSPNFIFGIYDGRKQTTHTPNVTVSGNNKTALLFQNWFEEHNLPYDYTDFNGRSDYGPFLAEGIVAAGLFSGADGIKDQKQYDIYKNKLGEKLAGIVNETYDQCYHRACDNINNINLYAYEKMIQAAASVLEILARQDNLKTWLY